MCLSIPVCVRVYSDVFPLKTNDRQRFDRSLKVDGLTCASCHSNHTQQC